MNGKKLPLALTPCLTSACTLWREGECIHIRTAGKPERPQVSADRDREYPDLNADTPSQALPQAARFSSGNPYPVHP